MNSLLSCHPKYGLSDFSWYFKSVFKLNLSKWFMNRQILIKQFLLFDCVNARFFLLQRIRIEGIHGSFEIPKKKKKKEKSTASIMKNTKEVKRRWTWEIQMISRRKYYYKYNLSMHTLINRLRKRSHTEEAVFFIKWKGQYNRHYCSQSILFA